MKPIVRKKDNKQREHFVHEELGELPISKALQKIKKDDSSVSYDFNKLNPSSQANKGSKWPAIGTAHCFKKSMNDAVCECFSSGREN